MSTQTLLINRDDIMALTPLNGNIDEDKILPHVNTAQEIHLQPVVGTKLLDKCKSLIEAGTLNDAGNEVYATLVNIYITPYLVFLTMWDAMPFIQYSIANGGVYQHQSVNSATPTDANVGTLTARFKNKAEFYGDKLSSYLCDNTSLYPELTESIDGGEFNSGPQQSLTNWNL
jgi:hypothetical protein